MYICPECGEKLSKNATICPCCGRGNKDYHNNKYDFILIVIGLILFSVGFITTVSFAYENIELTYTGANYSFTYKKSSWFSSKKSIEENDRSDVLLLNNNDQIYIQFDKEMIDLGFDTEVDSSREDLYNMLYDELLAYDNKEYSNISSNFKQIGDKYYLDLNYTTSDIKARMYILCYKTRIMSFYIVHGNNDYKEAETKLLEIFKTLEIK